MQTKSSFPVALLLALSILAPAAEQQPAPRAKPPEVWTRPHEPFRVVGNVYYIGTYDLSVFLITTPQGHMLINTGIEDSAAVIRANMEKLGFKYADIKLLLATHGHWDHVGAMAQIKAETGARMLIHEGDADMVETGGGVDYRFPNGRGPVYPPVKVDQRLKEGDKIALGGTELNVLHHPGHTKGSTSFTFTVREAGRSYNVLIANMGSINPGVNVAFMPAFKDITAAYLGTLERQKKLQPEIWLSSHAPQFNLYQKHKPGDAYDPNRFVDPDGYGAKIQFYEKLFRAALERDRTAQKPPGKDL